MGLVAVWLLFAGLLQGVGPVDGSTPSAATETIDGWVRDEWGTPIVGAELELRVFRPGAPVRSWRPGPTDLVAMGKSGVGGAFRFARLAGGGSWLLTVSAPGFLRWRELVEIPARADGVWTEGITLLALRSLSGVVRDRGGAPAPGAHVVLEDPGMLQGRESRVRRLERTADERGRFSFDGVSPGATLTLSAPGRATRIVRPIGRCVDPLARAMEQTFELDPGHFIEGRVLGPDGAGVPGIEVFAGSMDGSGSVRTDAEGRYRIEGLTTAGYTLSTREFEVTRALGVRPDAKDQVLTLRPPAERARIAGRVVDPDGRPLADFVVRTLQRAQNDFGVPRGRVRGLSDGSFVVERLPAGTYGIEVVAEGWANTRAEAFELAPGATRSDVVVRMTRGGVVAGRVLDETGAPLAGASVSVGSQSFVSRTRTTTTDADGRYLFERMTPGLVRVWVAAPDDACAWVDGVQVTDGQTTELPPLTVTAGIRVAGVVRIGGSPAAGASVQLYPVDPDGVGQRVARTNASGRFWIDGVRPGAYALSATRSDAMGMGDPFAALGDMNQSQTEVALEEGERYEFELALPGTPPVARR